MVTRRRPAYENTRRVLPVFVTFAFPAWMRDAACRGSTVDFFSEQTAAATAVCNGCPVRDACREYAYEHEITDGIWGGESEQERFGGVGEPWMTTREAAAALGVTKPHLPLIAKTVTSRYDEQGFRYWDRAGIARLARDRASGVPLPVIRPRHTAPATETVPGTLEEPTMPPPVTLDLAAGEFDLKFLRESSNPNQRAIQLPSIV